MFKLSRVPSAWMPEFLASFGRFRVSRPSSDAHPAGDVQLRQRILEQSATISRLRHAVARAEAHSREMRAQLDVRRRSGLSHQVLRRTLPVRAARLPVVPDDRAAAAAREHLLLAVSSAYRELLAGVDHGAVCTTEIDGLCWWIPSSASDAERIRRAQRQGFPYRAILQTREVAIGGFMLDIGANIGRTSIPRVILGDVRGVYAAEPEPANYECLVRNVVEHHLQGFVLPDRVAIGAARGEARMRQSRYPGGHHLLRGADDRSDAIAVEVWPLDEWMTRLGIEAGAVTFVKVDTQGSELAVLRGASSLLARAHVSWLIEMDPRLLRRAGADVHELLELIRRHFSLFIDIGAPGAGPRVRPVTQLAESLSYLGSRQTKTDLLLFHAA